MNSSNQNARRGRSSNQRNQQSRGRNNRQNNQRGRGRNNGNHSNGQSDFFDSRGPDINVRGSAQQLIDKYLQLAKDARSSNDLILMENFLQHADHYQRIILSRAEYERANQVEMEDFNEDRAYDLDNEDDDSNDEPEEEKVKIETKAAPKRRTKSVPKAQGETAEMDDSSADISAILPPKIDSTRVKTTRAKAKESAPSSEDSEDKPSTAKRPPRRHADGKMAEKAGDKKILTTKKAKKSDDSLPAETTITAG